MATLSKFVIYPLSSVHLTAQMFSYSQNAESLKSKTDFLKMPKSRYLVKNVIYKKSLKRSFALEV